MPSRVDDYDENRRVHHFTVNQVSIGNRAFDPVRDIVRSMQKKRDY